MSADEIVTYTFPKEKKKKKESGWNLQTNKKKGKSWGNMEKLLQELKTKANFINWLIKKM